MTGRTDEARTDDRGPGSLGRALATSLPARLVDLRLLPGHRRYRRFIVLAAPRTGSNMLVSALDQHPAIRAMGEVFGETDEMVVPFVRTVRGRRALVARRDRDPVGFLEDVIFRAAPRSVRAAGFKIFHHHCWQPKWREVWPHLERMEGLHVIHLARRNLLRAFASFRLAERTDRWVRYDDVTGFDDERVTLGVEACREHFTRTIEWRDAYAARFAHAPHLSLEYETMVANLGACLGDVQRFLGVPVRELRPRTRRQNPRPLRRMIANYDELRDAFAPTPYARFFDEGEGGP